MIRRNLLGALCALSLMTMPGYGQIVLDLSGHGFYGPDWSIGNEIVVFDLDDSFFNVIVAIEYDLTIQTFGDSWLSDPEIRFGNSDGTFHGIQPDTFIPGLGVDESGTQRFTGFFDVDIHLNPDLEFHFELFDFRDNVFDGYDAILLEGSTITLYPFVPAPGSLAMISIGGVAVMRRRR